MGIAENRLSINCQWGGGGGEGVIIMLQSFKGGKGGSGKFYRETTKIFPP